MEKRDDRDVAAEATSLVIAGMVPMSSVDWPGKLAASLFLQGCPWRCSYCQNADILDPRVPGQVAWGDVVALLQRRHGLLDGVVFSGGEATRQEALVAATRQVRDMGFEVGLHTGGAYPARLERLLPLLNWVGLDIKALPEHYAAVVLGAPVGGAGGAKAGESAWRALDLVLAERARREDFSFEVRLTVCPSLGADVPEGEASPEELTVRGAVEVARRCREAGVETFALQEARTLGVEASAAARMDAALAVDGGAAWRERWEALVAEVEALGFPDLQVRV